MPDLETDAHIPFQSGGLYWSQDPDAIDLRKYAPYENEIEWAHNNSMEERGFIVRRYTKAGITNQ